MLKKPHLLKLNKKGKRLMEQKRQICSLSAAFVGVISIRFLSQTDKIHISKSLQIQKLFRNRITF